jgi:hypothetical protein
MLGIHVTIYSKKEKQKEENELNRVMTEMVISQVFIISLIPIF